MRTDGDDHDKVVRLLGGLELDGADGTSTWTRLRVDRDRESISAVVAGGDRATILRSDEDDDHFHRGGDGDNVLELTLAGAQSLNRATTGSPSRPETSSPAPAAAADRARGRAGLDSVRRVRVRSRAGA